MGLFEEVGTVVRHYKKKKGNLKAKGQEMAPVALPQRAGEIQGLLKWE